MTKNCFTNKKITAAQKIAAWFFALSFVLQNSAFPFVALADSSSTPDAHKVSICHIPEGNPENMQTISVDENSVTLEAHLKHGDSIGPCATPPPPPPENLPPVITILGGNPAQVLLGGTYNDPGASALDPEDGDISGHIISSGMVDTQTLGTYTIAYNVSDSGGLAATPQERVVNVVSDASVPPRCSDGLDNDGDGFTDFPSDPGCVDSNDNDELDGRPTITLLGDATTSITQGGVFADPGATASDPEDGDITENIVRTGTIDTQNIGSYILTYNVSDRDGNAAIPATRTVSVFSGENTGGGGGSGGGDGGGSGGGSGGGGGGSVPPQCADGSDNDGDGLADYPNDPGCDSSQDNDEVNSMVPPPETLVGGGGSTSGGSSGGGGGGGGVVEGVATTSEVSPGEVLGESSCSYLRDYLRLGMKNDPSEVTKLQTFLRDFEGFTDLPVTGIFDLETDKAVRVFQDRYKDDVLLPWDLSGNTGYVYYTTRKKINEIYCQGAFPLDKDQLSEISAFRKLVSGLNTAKQKNVASAPPNTAVASSENGEDAVLKDRLGWAVIERSNKTLATLFATTSVSGAAEPVAGTGDRSSLAAVVDGTKAESIFSLRTFLSGLALLFWASLLCGTLIHRYLLLRHRATLTSSFPPGA